MRTIALVASLALVAACSPSQEDSQTAAPDAVVTDNAAPPPAADNVSARTLTLEGLGDLRIGSPVPASSSFAERGAQIPGSECRTISSPDYPGVYAITIGAEGPAPAARAVRRISVAGDSDIALVEGIGVGSAEADVRAAFPSFTEEPHKYVDAPAKYLTQPGDDPRLRFEIDEDGRVAMIHVGVMPELAYVEGCA